MSIWVCGGLVKSELWFRKPFCYNLLYFLTIFGWCSGQNSCISVWSSIPRMILFLNLILPGLPKKINYYYRALVQKMLVRLATEPSSFVKRKSVGWNNRGCEFIRYHTRGLYWRADNITNNSCILNKKILQILDLKSWVYNQEQFQIKSWL